MERMDPKRRNTPNIELERALVERAIHDLRTSLTVVYGNAQLLERRSRIGISATPAQTEATTSAISRACVAMLQALEEIEDASNRQ